MKISHMQDEVQTTNIQNSSRFLILIFFEQVHVPDSFVEIKMITGIYNYSRTTSLK